MMEIRGKGKPVFCGKDGKWEDELEKRLPTDDEIMVLALGARYCPPKHVVRNVGVKD